MKELIDNSEMLVLGVTPKVVGFIIDELAQNYRPDQVMLTVVTGVEQPWYQEHLGKDCKVVICMPNMSSQVGEGAFAVSRSEACTDEDVDKVCAILRSCGLVEEIPDGMMAEILPFNGSAPGFFYHIANLMVKEAKELGLDPETAFPGPHTAWQCSPPNADWPPPACALPPRRLLQTQVLKILKRH